MREFLQKISKFMEGRYGHDKLGTFLLIITAIMYLILLFTKVSWLFVLMIIPLLLYAFRALSKNINKRLYENRMFLRILHMVTAFFKNQWMKIRDFRTHRYVRCPYCKSQLRLKKRTGKHVIHCPRCNEDFTKTIIF